MLDKARIGLRHTNSVANIGAVTANENTAVTLVPANEARIALWVNGGAKEPIWIRFQPAFINNTTKEGILLVKEKESLKVTGDGDVYTGEVSVIMKSGSDEDVAFTEF